MLEWRFFHGHKRRQRKRQNFAFAKGLFQGVGSSEGHDLQCLRALRMCSSCSSKRDAAWSLPGCESQCSGGGEALAHGLFQIFKRRCLTYRVRLLHLQQNKPPSVMGLMMCPRESVRSAPSAFSLQSSMWACPTGSKTNTKGMK